MKLKLSEPQSISLTIRAATTLIMAGQRAGKTMMIGIRTGLLAKYFPKIIGLIGANTYKQLTQSTMVEVRKTWKNFFEFSEYDKSGNPNGVYVVGKKPPLHFRKFHEFDDYSGIISFRNGKVIFIVSLENYLVHEGKTIGWAELDETKDTKQTAVKQVILARLSQKGLYYDDDTNELSFIDTECNEIKNEDDRQVAIEQAIERTKDLIPYNPCFINTSPSEGTVDWLEDMFDLKSRDEDILNTIIDPSKFYYEQFGNKSVLIYSTYFNHHNLPGNYIDKRIEELTESEQLKFIFGYPFSKTGDEYFHEFDRRKHIRDIEYDMSVPVHLTYDFNVKPYMTLIACQVIQTSDELSFNFYKEYCMKPPENSTEAVTQSFMDDHAGALSDVFYYGDAMGTRRIEGFGDGITRFDDVRDLLDLYLDDDSDRTTRSNPPVMKRRKIVNKIFAGKLYFGPVKVSINIDRSCEELIRDLQYLKLGANGKLKEYVTDEETKERYEKLGHTSDAMEYLIAYILQDYL